MLPLGNIRIITLNNTVSRFRRFGFLFLVLGLLFSPNLSSQILSLQDQLTTELEKHGLEYQEVREALFIRGYDIENMTELTPDQVDDIREIMQFLIAQKQAIIAATPSIDTIETD